MEPIYMRSQSIDCLQKSGKGVRASLPEALSFTYKDPAFTGESSAQMLRPYPKICLEAISEIWSEWRRQKLPLYLFLLLCFNLVVAPAVFAAGGEALSRTQSYALGILVIVTTALAIYLFVVMFQPERF